MDFIVLGCPHLCTGFIQLRMLQMFHTELCNQPKATLCCHCGRTDQGTINYISPGDALCIYLVTLNDNVFHSDKKETVNVPETNKKKYTEGNL